MELARDVSPGGDQVVIHEKLAFRPYQNRPVLHVHRLPLAPGVVRFRWIGAAKIDVGVAAGLLCVRPEAHQTRASAALVRANSRRFIGNSSLVSLGFYGTQIKLPVV